MSHIRTPGLPHLFIVHGEWHFNGNGASLALRYAAQLYCEVKNLKFINHDWGNIT